MSTLVIERRARMVERVSRRGCEAAGMLGMSIDRAAPPGMAGRVELVCEPGSVVLVRGASGSGKSTLLADAMAAARAQGWMVVEAGDAAIDRSRACIDVMGGDVDGAMRRLARAGLAEGGVWLRRVGDLSAGERARLEVAVALERASRLRIRGRVLVVIDGMCESLDRVTARSVALLLARAVIEMPWVCVMAASVREDLEGFLRPWRVAEVGVDGCVRVRGSVERSAVDDIEVRIERGTMADYERLARWHYRGGAPATSVRVLRAIGEGEVVGVLVVSMPALNASWRRLAWGERFVSGDRGRDARAINRGLRCISRVVVDPRWRGMGVARDLVAAYLGDRETACTEAIAAMGRFTGFFQAAGMRRLEVAMSARDERLRAAFEQVGLSVWRLAMTDAAARAIARDPVLEGELRRWARASRATARHAKGSVAQLVDLAWKSIAARRAVFVHGEPDGAAERERAA